MLDSKYLYDIDLRIYEDLSYKQVLLTKIILAKKLMHKLVRIDNMFDNTRINKVCKAIQFNNSLLLELGLSQKDISLALNDNTLHIHTSKNCELIKGENHGLQT